jgi:hypothetical protein
VCTYCTLYCDRYANVSNNCHAIITVPLFYEHGTYINDAWKGTLRSSRSKKLNLSLLSASCFALRLLSWPADCCSIKLISAAPKNEIIVYKYCLVACN